MRARWIVVAVVVVLAVAVGVFAVVRMGGTEESPAYVALGDSYAAGTGTSEGDDEDNPCRRSDEAHPHLLAAASAVELDFVACSGATTADLLAEQVPAVGADTRMVTVTIGGNDVGFTRALRVCALTPESTECTGQVAEAEAVLAALPDTIATVIAAVRERAPEARIHVTGYPLLVGAGVADGSATCRIATFDVPAELAAATVSVNTGLNAAIAAGVAAAGDEDAVFVDVVGIFEGHDLCAADPWINGVVASGGSASVNSFHLNAAGERAYAEAITAAGFGG